MGVEISQSGHGVAEERKPHAENGDRTIRETTRPNNPAAGRDGPASAAAAIREQTAIGDHDHAAGQNTGHRGRSDASQAAGRGKRRANTRSRVPAAKRRRGYERRSRAERNIVAAGCAE